MQRNKLASERYPNTTLYLAKECLGFLSKHSEVDISKMYKWVNDVNKFFNDYGTSDFVDCIKNGTLLSKGHGDLKDELDLDLFAPNLGTNEYINELMAKHNIDYANGDDEDKVRAFASDLIHSCMNVIKTAPTIIKADESEE